MTEQLRVHMSNKVLTKYVKIRGFNVRKQKTSIFVNTFARQSDF